MMRMAPDRSQYRGPFYLLIGFRYFGGTNPINPIYQLFGSNSTSAFSAGTLPAISETPDSSAEIENAFLV
jgi:hypothetical protein